MADDVMIFPDTWKEFEKQYGFYDSKQAYMYGNTRLIPSFRVQQWLDHIDDIKRKKQLQKNKMVQIAKMFGKKLGERFCIIRYGDRYDARFLERGFEVYGLENPYVDMDSFVLMGLLTGRAAIMEDEK